MVSARVAAAVGLVSWVTAVVGSYFAGGWFLVLTVVAWNRVYTWCCNALEEVPGGKRVIDG